jgi:hypothetical protein
MKADENRRGTGKKAEVHHYTSFDRLKTQQKAEDQPAQEDEREEERPTKTERWHSFKTP